MPRTHSTLPRLLVDASLGPDGLLDLGKTHVNYLLNVLRRAEGDHVVVFNGHNGAWLGEIVNTSRKKAQLRLIEQVAAQTPSSDLWYGLAPLKSARLDYVVQKATEMGVGIIQPVVTRHTQVNRLKLDRWRANAVEAAEQCEVLTIPEVRAEIALEHLIADWDEREPGRHLLFADESALSASPVETLKTLADRRIGILIGPEGGFAEDERALLLAQPFVTPISLGPRILRADTAAVAALAVIQSIIGDWR